jgi:cob(I)alamin adenosyltransferase
MFGVLGDLDELGSWLGVLKHLGQSRRELEDAQRRLLTLGSLVATDPALDSRGAVTSPVYAGLARITGDDVSTLEVWEKRLMARVEIQPQFVLTGGTKKAAWCDVARTVCRRAERSLVALIRSESRSDLTTGARWVNRLSDVLFVLARVHAKR